MTVPWQARKNKEQSIQSLTDPAVTIALPFYLTMTEITVN